jgi:hypothetical protein
VSDAEKVGSPLARRAIALDPGDAEARAVLAIQFLLRGDHEAVEGEADRALD